MRIRQLPGASQDLDEALGHYSSIHKSLAGYFAEEIDRAVRRIVERPLAWHPLGGGLRRFVLRRFPYSIIYRADRDEVLIVAYAHHRRLPGYWRRRKTEHGS